LVQLKEELPLLKLHSDQPGPPCGHMEPLLNSVADESAGRFAKWYALAHAARCRRCFKYLDYLRIMLGRLRMERDVGPEVVVLGRLEAALTRAVEEASLND
jgi:hypothetical protein